MITADILHKVCGKSNPTIDSYVDPLNKACAFANINTKQRVSAFLAQVIVESGSFQSVVENLNYSAAGLLATWPKRFTTQTAAAYARQPEKIANHVYANRYGNRDEASGDGWKFRGRGLIELTFHDNYVAFAAWKKITLDEAVAYTQTPEGATMSAAWFWDSHHLNAIADTGNIDAVSRAVNGGDNGLAQRNKYYHTAMSVLG
jgi:putative chitinase